jgi:hypothetical protein
MLEGLVQGLFENLAELLPVKVVRSYERGVKWTLGRNPTQLDPGPHLRVWFYHSIETAIVADDTIELPTQSIITKDEKLVVFKAIIGFKIDDIVKHFTNVTDFRESTTGLVDDAPCKARSRSYVSRVGGGFGEAGKVALHYTHDEVQRVGHRRQLRGFSDFAEVPTQIRIFGEGAPFVRTVTGGNAKHQSARAARRSGLAAVAFAPTRRRILRGRTRVGFHEQADWGGVSSADVWPEGDTSDVACRAQNNPAHPKRIGRVEGRLA